MRQVERVEGLKEVKTAYKILVKKYPERASLGEIMHKQDYIKMSWKEQDVKD